jgi:alkylated DNA repair protein (DNA oxidative demethylase)
MNIAGATRREQAMIPGLFDAEPQEMLLAPGAALLCGFARPVEGDLVAAVQWVAGHAPFRHMATPGGRRMSVAMTNCGTAGWITDRAGYRYDVRDPESGKDWPPLPEAFIDLARRAAARAGFNGFAPDACLVNRYVPGARLSLHQDRNERDFGAPIVSVSLGLPAVFLFGGTRRTDSPRRVPLAHGDVVVWGGASRLRYHGVLPIKEGHHPIVGRYRVNLTLRLAR